MRVVLPVILITCLQINAAPPEVALAGTVTDTAAAPIGNARVYLKHYPELFTMTDSTGAFTLPQADPVRFARPSRAFGGVAVQGNRILYTRGGKLDVFGIDLFRLNGERIFSRKLENPADGSRFLALPKTAQGIYLARITVDNEVGCAKLVVGEDAGILSLTMQSAVSGGMQTHAKAAAAVSDSLIVFARGYRNAQYPIDAYDTKEIAIELTVSHPWRSMSYPDMTDTMAKILSKGYDFEMGQPDPDIGGEGSSASEQAVHTVSFTYDFWMDMTEVTQKAYREVMTEAYPEFVAPEWPEAYGVGDEYPAYNLSWADAALYCNALSKTSGLDTVYTFTGITGTPGKITCALSGLSFDITKNGYRLPTEAEWEYACKAGIFEDFYWERSRENYPSSFLDTIEVNSYEVWRAVSLDKGEGDTDYGTHKVAEKIHNYYHLFDMAGNVSEYCNDFATDSYDYEAVTDPIGPADGEEHVIRGGNWASDAEVLRSENRTFSSPDSSVYFIGFRTVKRIFE
jgi:formylglycine-generating enzyme